MGKAKSDDDIARMMAMLKRIDSNERYAELIEESARVTRMMVAEPDLSRRCKLDKFVQACDRKLAFWRNRPDWDINEVARLRRQFRH